MVRPAPTMVETKMSFKDGPDGPKMPLLNYPQGTDIVGVRRHVANVPDGEVACLSITRSASLPPASRRQKMAVNVIQTRSWDRA